MRYEVKKDGQKIQVWDNQKKGFITKPVPSMAIAQEICDDFNAMDNKDFRAIGGPDFSKKVN